MRKKKKVKNPLFIIYLFNLSYSRSFSTRMLCRFLQAFFLSMHKHTIKRERERENANPKMNNEQNKRGKN